jgi:hypothetical protein
LALLYNAPRAATITSDAESLLFVLDRQTFNHIVKDASIRKKEKYESFLKTVSLLETLDDYERSPRLSKIANSRPEITLSPRAIKMEKTCTS